MKKQLTITVAGHAGCGKTTITREIATHLQALGFNVEVASEPDGDDTPELHALRMPELIMHADLLTIKVQAVQLQRPLSGGM